MRKYLCILCTLICVFLLTACSSSASFKGSRTGNEDQFIMKYSIFNTTDSQILELNKGDILNVEVVSDSGKVSSIIQKSGDKPIYKEENIPTSSFEVEIENSGAYKIEVTGEQAVGSISFIKSADK